MLPDSVFAFIVGLEGGDTVTEDARDPGGLTKWGISQRAFPSLDIRALTRLEAHAIYDRHYWQACRCDDLSLALAVAVFDCAVNQGVSVACKLLQRAVGVSPDGVLGPVTMKALRNADQHKAVFALLKLRAARYLATNNAAEERFEAGWMNRLLDVAAEATR